MKTNRIITVLLAFGLVVFSCKKEEAPEPEPVPVTETGSMQLEFENTVDGLPINFTDKYLHPKGDTFTISKFNYYISNVVLTKTDNSIFVVPNSYYLVQAGQAGSNLITLGNVPAAGYKSIQLMLGVDSARNTSGAQSGDLDPGKGMFWSWTTGYIMLKLEGKAQTSSASNKLIEYHMGGFKGPNKTQRIFNLNFAGGTAYVTKSGSTKITLSVNANELFQSPTLIDFANLPIITQAGVNAKTMADNYADMILFKRID